MVDKDPIIKEAKIKYSGVFDLELLYKKIQEWAKRLKFDEIKEVKYVERVKPFGKVIDFVWKTSKEELDGYIGMELEIKFLIAGLTDIELDRPSGKIKLNKGSLEVAFSSTLVRNAKKGWGNKSLIKKLYERFIIPEQIENFKIGLYKDTEDMINETKNFLALYQF